MYTAVHAIRVDIYPDQDIYCLIVTGADDVKSFYLINESCGDPVFMFACKTANDTESVEFATKNAVLYIPEEWENE